MNKKIASELAIGIILIVAIVIGGIFWLQGKEQKVSSPSNNACKSHYYEGESGVNAWAVSSDQDSGGGIIVRIAKEDAQKLPIKNADGNLTLRLIDPTDAVQSSLNSATEKKPAAITLKGYAEICEKKPPEVSLEQATVAFKKS
jgi:hypothetical protein